MKTKQVAKICWDGGEGKFFVRLPDGQDVPVGDGTEDECWDWCRENGYEGELTEAARRNS